ncbi:MAG: hypothetical protein WC655_24480 [Candidatus Hydrogenedentales bacterium]|jgi:hypothetical protein
MNIETKINGWSRWLPLFVSLITNAVLFGVFYGRTTKEIESLHQNDSAIRSELMPMEKRLMVFVSRSEYVVKMESIDRQLEEIKLIGRETNRKLDELFRR